MRHVKPLKNTLTSSIKTKCTHILHPCRRMWLNKKNKKAITMTRNKKETLKSKSKKILLMKINLKRMQNRENQR